MLKIRLKRLGGKKTPAFRIIVINSTTKREGKPIQELGHYNPKTKIMKLDKETALNWIKKGAQPTETVQYLINNCTKEGTLNYKQKTEKKLSKKAIAKAETEKEAKAAKAQAEKEAAVQAKEAAVKAEASVPAEETATEAALEKEISVSVEEAKVEAEKVEVKSEIPAEIKAAAETSVTEE